VDHKNSSDSDKISNNYSNENDSPQSQTQRLRSGSWDDDYSISPPKASINALSQSQSPSRVLDEVLELLSTPRGKEPAFASNSANISAVLQFDHASPITPISPSPVLTLGLGPPQFSPDAAKASEAIYQAYGLMSLSSSLSNLSLAQTSNEGNTQQEITPEHDRNIDNGKIRT
jgi:hypothetical protein